jgi:trimeric autotransporter adhesin
VKDIFPGPDNSVPIELADVDGTLYFQANPGTGGRTLWKSDGTADGTTQVDFGPAIRIYRFLASAWSRMT